MKGDELEEDRLSVECGLGFHGVSSQELHHAHPVRSRPVEVETLVEDYRSLVLSFRRKGT